MEFFILLFVSFAFFWNLSGIMLAVKNDNIIQLVAAVVLTSITLFPLVLLIVKLCGGVIHAG